MLKNYPTTHLFLLSLISLMVLVAITSLVGGWHTYVAAVMDVLNFTVKIVCVFFLLGTVIEVANGMLSRKHLH